MALFFWRKYCGGLRLQRILPQLHFAAAWISICRTSFPYERIDINSALKNSCSRLSSGSRAETPGGNKMLRAVCWWCAPRAEQREWIIFIVGHSSARSIGFDLDRSRRAAMRGSSLARPPARSLALAPAIEQTQEVVYLRADAVFCQSPNIRNSKQTPRSNWLHSLRAHRPWRVAGTRLKHLHGC